MKNNAYFEMHANELTHPWYRATRSILINFLSLNFKKSAVILDAGCGTGGTIKALKKAGYVKVIGVDNSKLALELCKKRGVNNVFLASINKLPFKNKTFDVVICLDVLYHQGVSVKKALRELHRVLKPGGIIYLEEPAYNWLTSKHDIAIETRRRFTKKQLVNYLNLTNFKIIKSSYFNTILFLPILAERVIYKLSNDKNPKSDVYPIPAILDNIIYKIFKIESMLISKVSLPFGLSIICIGQK